MTAPQDQNEPGRIVVGIDGSDASPHALRWAVALARATGARVEAVFVWTTYPSRGWIGGSAAQAAGVWDPQMEAEKALVTAVDQEFGADRPTSLDLVVREGTPAQVLIEAGKGAQMLIVGSRGHGGFVGLLLGSVSTACAEHASCPVLVLHGATELPAPAGVIA